jgi:hypothetical protein
VECFCFEEQKLLAGEEVDMPLLFFIDKDVLEDPACTNVDDVVLSYTFFRCVLLHPHGFIQLAQLTIIVRGVIRTANWNQTLLMMSYRSLSASPSMSMRRERRIVEMKGVSVVRWILVLQTVPLKLLH